MHSAIRYPANLLFTFYLLNLGWNSIRSRVGSDDLTFISRLSRGDLGYTVIYIQTPRCIFTMFSENSIVSCHWGWSQLYYVIKTTTKKKTNTRSKDRMRERLWKKERKRENEVGGGGGRLWNSTTSDSHWNITTQRETSIRKNGLI